MSKAEAPIRSGNEWKVALSQKGAGYVAELRVSGYSFFAYIIPNADYPGYGSIFIPLEPIVITLEDLPAKNFYTLSDEEIQLTVRGNVGLDESSILNFLGAEDVVKDDKKAKRFKFEKYTEATSGEKGIKITNLSESMNKLEGEFSKEMSTGIFVLELVEHLKDQFEGKISVIIEPRTLPQLRDIVL